MGSRNGELKSAWAPRLGARTNAVESADYGRNPGSPTLGTNASIGPACLCEQSADVAPDLREAEKFAPVRLVGTSSRAHPANKTDITRRAKVGYCPCCARPTHVATPPTRAGEISPIEVPRAPSLGEFGGLGPRHLAAFRTAETYGSPPKRGIWRPRPSKWLPPICFWAAPRTPPTRMCTPLRLDPPLSFQGRIAKRESRSHVSTKCFLLRI